MVRRMLKMNEIRNTPIENLYKKLRELENELFVNSVQLGNKKKNIKKSIAKIKTYLSQIKKENAQSKERKNLKKKKSK